MDPTVYHPSTWPDDKVVWHDTGGGSDRITCAEQFWLDEPGEVEHSVAGISVWANTLISSPAATARVVVRANGYQVAVCEDEADACARDLDRASATQDLLGMPVTLASADDCKAIAAALRTAAYAVRCISTVADFALDEDRAATAPITEEEHRAVASRLEEVQQSIAGLSRDDAELTVGAVLRQVVKSSTRVEVSTHRVDGVIGIDVGTARFTVAHPL